MNNSLTVTKSKAITENQDIYQLVDDWKKALDLAVASGERSETTVKTYKKGFEKFLSWAEDHQLKTVDGDTIRRWKADLIRAKCKPATVNVWLSGVRDFFAWSVGNNRLVVNPTEGVHGAKRKGTSKSHKREILSDLEVKRLLSLPDRSTLEGRRDFAMLNLFLYTGIRTVELHRAKLADLHVNGQMILNVTGKGHDESDEIVVIDHQAAQNALYDWLAVRGGQPGALFTSLSDRSRGDRLSLVGIRSIVKAYFKRAGIVGAGKTTHSLRHTAASSALRNGASPLQVQKMLRHKSVETTMIYIHELNRLTDPGERFINYDK